MVVLRLLNKRFFMEGLGVLPSCGGDGWSLGNSMLCLDLELFLLGVANEHSTSTPHSSSWSSAIHRSLLRVRLELLSTLIGFHTFLGGLTDLARGLRDSTFLIDSFFFFFDASGGSPILRTTGLTFILFRLFESLSTAGLPADIRLALSASSSSHSLIHQDSAQDIHDLAIRFLIPRRILLSTMDMDVEREKDETDDVVDDMD